MEPRWRKTFTRNRPMCGMEYAKSTSPESLELLHPVGRG